MSKLLWSALALALVAQPAAAAVEIYAKPGAALDDIQSAEALCTEQARSTGVHRATQASQYIAPAIVGGPLGLASAALLGGVQEGVHKARELQRRTAACMRMKGFARLALTPEEETAYGKAGAAGRGPWTQRYMSGDIAQRVETALTPATPPLPKLGPEPFAVGGVKLDASGLAAASGPVAAKGVLLTGKATHRRVAKVGAGLEEKAGPVRITVAPGAVFYGVEYRPDAESEEASSVWCGPTREKALLASGTPVHCFVSDVTGYRLLLQDDYAGLYAAKKPWMVGPMSQGPGNFLITSGKLDLQPGEEDLIGPMDVKLTVAKISDKEVGLAASATRDGKSVDVWRGTLPWGADGKAVLPFWTHRLTLTRKGETVEAAYTPDGDGRGWIDPPAETPKAQVAAAGAAR